MSIPTIREFEAMHKGRFDSYYDLAIAFAYAHCESQAKSILEIGYSEMNEDPEKSIKEAYPLTNIK